MAYNELKALLEKYYDGETSLKEESRIRMLLRHKSIGSEFEIERQIFGVFTEMKKESNPPASLNSDILDAIDAKNNSRSIRWLRQPMRRATAAAACLFFAFFVSQQFDSQDVKIVDTYKDEKKAYKATKKVLGFVSGKLNAEALKLKELSAINENLSHINNLKKIDKEILNLNNKGK